jgi:hypothetical protein
MTSVERSTARVLQSQPSVTVAVQTDEFHGFLSTFCARTSRLGLPGVAQPNFHVPHRSRERIGHDEVHEPREQIHLYGHEILAAQVLCPEHEFERRDEARQATFL